MSPLLPLSIRDLLMLEIVNSKRSNGEYERWKMQFEDELRRHTETMSYLLDIRHIQLSKLPFDSKQQRINYINDLPSKTILSDGKKQNRAVGISKGARKKMQKK